MSNRRPAERTGPALTRTAGSYARSPAERLEPTRPTGRPRRAHLDEEPGSVRPLLRFLNGLLTFVLLLMVLIGAVAFALNSEFDAPGPLASAKVVVVPKGDGAQEIGARLEREGVVGDRRLFVAAYLWMKLSGWLSGAKPVQLKAGDFELRQNASVRQLVEIMSEGKTVSYKVTVPEGLTSYQIVERLKADQSLSGEIAAVPAEGALLPETFVVHRGASRQSVIDNMVAESRKAMDKLWEGRKKDLPFKTPQEAIVLASIIEKETGRNDERDRVAAVFVNRLKQNMRLQSDPTILYGMFAGRTVWGRPILRSEISQKTAHNTYQIEGLPPTPICNPGRAAIEAVLNPADTSELYFVADGNGGHVFAETLKEHNANVQKWRAVEKDMKAKSAPAPAPGDTPTTATERPPDRPKTRAVIRTAPPPEPDRGTPAAPKKLNAAPRSDNSWATTTTPPPPKAKQPQ